MNCRGRLVKDTTKAEGEQYAVTREYSHAPDTTTVGVAVAINSLKRKAVDTIESSRSIIATVCKDLDEATSAAMPSKSALYRRIKRARTEYLPTSTSNKVDLIRSR